MRYIFGPVASRRFGRSLGIDLSPQRKQCNFNCVYCELGAGKLVSAMSEPCEIGPVIAELKTALAVHPNIDVITITANGEPTLHPRFAELVDALKALNLPQKLLVLSNGSLVRENSAALAKLDICKFSLDSALAKSFRKVDGPHAGISAEDIVSAIADFAREFRGELDIEILVVRGLNDTQEDFAALNAFSSHQPAPRRSRYDRSPARIPRAGGERGAAALSGHFHRKSKRKYHRRAQIRKRAVKF